MAAASTLFLLRILFLLILYLFLGTVLFIIWRDLGTAEKAPPRAKKPRAPGYLLVVGSGETGLATGDRLPLHPVTALGRDLSNDVVLTDTFASAHHALLTYRQSRWWLEDLGSRNGTTVNGNRMNRPIPLDRGDIIGIGEALLKLE